MRTDFIGYYRPTQEELEAIWTEGSIVFDTNALLNLYRYSSKTRDEFLSVMSALESSLWIPHQVALEFHRRRHDVLDDQDKAVQGLRELASGIAKQFETELNKYRRHPSIDSASILELVGKHVSPIVQGMEELASSHGKEAENHRESESILNAVTTLFDGRVGPAWDNETLKNAYTEGATRYEQEIPPGFKDKSKPEPERYGDFILWKQLLAHGFASKKPAIFVTDDGKEDWWWRRKGKTIGPRIELVREYQEVAGKRIHFYSPEQFLRYASDRLRRDLGGEALEEVHDVSGDPQDSAIRSIALDHLSFLQRRVESHKRDLDRLLRMRDQGRELPVMSAREQQLLERRDQVMDSRKRTEAHIDSLQEAMRRTPPDQAHFETYRNLLSEARSDQDRHGRQLAVLAEELESNRNRQERVSQDSLERRIQRSSVALEHMQDELTTVALALQRDGIDNHD